MVYVSMTTIDSRIDVVYYSVLSILEQAEYFDKLYLWVSKEPFSIDNGINSIPNRISNLQSDKFRVRYTDNLGPYRKIYPLIDEMDDQDIVVIADDDAIYKRHWLNQLLSKSKENEFDVIACMARRPVKTIFGSYQHYSNWKIVSDNERDPKLLPIGIGGVLYKKFFFDRDINPKDLNKIAHCKDDLMFKFLTFKNVQSVSVVSSGSSYFSPINTPTSLFDENILINKGHFLNFRKAISRFGPACPLIGYLNVVGSNNNTTYRTLIRRFGYEP